MSKDYWQRRSKCHMAFSPIISKVVNLLDILAIKHNRMLYAGC